ncbi:DEAD/DEAH box helicase family protein [Ornithinimicrobium cerasi]|uniref:DEAD/DEAH box helicase family protein n=1 Tax=Ornithinimicrobium cerasi TaxID=2248773 RepID=UPI0014825ED7|nr:DEAD/DEAH box helicase family protein [Ornithinimicrobium cerasi]
MTRQLLLAVYGAVKDDGAVDRVRKLDDKALAAQAARVFGTSGINKRHRDVTTPVLRSAWLPGVAAQELIDFARLVQLELTGKARAQKLRTKRDALAFLAARRATDTFKINLSKFFARLNKVQRTVTGRAPAAPAVAGPVGPRKLAGQGQPDPRTPYPHQEQAWANLDALTEEEQGRRAGLLVLPTGAGKTYTMVHWLLRRLARDPDVRVLWVADQQELVEQAGRVFEELGPTMPKGTTREIRVLHGAADSVSHLGSDALDIACVTRQSLVGAQFDQGAQKRVATYLQRPTVVVIDEAHHAVAPQYHRLLDFMQEHASRTVLVGLTATPWPAGTGQVKRLLERFPTRVAAVEVRDLVRSGVLATPVIHTINTDIFVPITTKEAARIVNQDIPGDVLRKLDQEPRTRTLVRTWVARREEWGKTLVFAPTIENANKLGDAFRDAGATTWVVHSRADEPRREAIAAFRKFDAPSVLVSVGMLREGVDLPDARTAFLARPTTSRILMRQMIGRVLRGPSAGGDAHAHVVDFRDRWGADIDILAPADLPDLHVEPENPTEPEYRLPPILDEVTQEAIGEDILRRIEAAYEELWRVALPHPGALLTTRLVGFYELGEVNVPVLDHCQAAWDQLVHRALGHIKGHGSYSMVFDDCPVPRPAERDVKAVVSFCEAYETEPPLVKVSASFSIRAVARDLVDQPAMTEAQKHAWLQQKWASSLARAAFPSYQHFVEEVTRAAFQLMNGATGTEPETWPVTPSQRDGRPVLSERERDLTHMFSATVAEGRTLLGSDSEYRHLLGAGALPRYEWTRTRPRGLWAYWAPRIAGRNKGTPIIRVNRILKATQELVPDRLIQALLWHELCHHLLPGRGHDAEFRRLEALWPDLMEQGARLDRLHEEFDLMANPRKRT